MKKLQFDKPIVKEKNLNIRVSQETMIAWKSAAVRDGAPNLTRWITVVLNQQAGAK